MSSFKLRGMNRDSQEEAVQLREDDLGVQEPVRGQVDHAIDPAVEVQAAEATGEPA